MIKKMMALTAVLLVSGSLAASEITPLVDVDWIRANSCAEGVRVLDIRSAMSGNREADFQAAHIPCAVYSDYMKAGWRAKVDEVPGQTPPIADLERLIGSLGIDNETHVVIYHAGVSALDLGAATRVYWTFKVLGHDKVSILDGGMAAYEAAKAPTARVPQQVPTLSFKANVREEMLIDKDDVARALGTDVVMVDFRPSDNFSGINRHPDAKRSGTLPGARNLPEAWLTVNNGGQLRDRDTIARLFDIADVPTSGAQIAFCNTGHWAALGWFVSSEIMGNPDVKMYDGSMVEWSADPSLPMVADVAL